MSRAYAMMKLTLAFAFVATAVSTACGGQVAPSENSTVLPGVPTGVSSPPPTQVSAAPPKSVPSVASTPQIRPSRILLDASVLDPPVSDSSPISSGAEVPVVESGRLLEPSDASIVDSGEKSDADIPSTAQDAQAPDASVADEQPTIPWCAAHATTTVRIVANLDLDATVPINDWSTNFSTVQYSRAAASNFSSTVTVYDSAGTNGTLDTYFRNAGTYHWQYHCVLGNGGAGIEVASGLLEFDIDGALRHREILQPLRMPSIDGTWGPEINYLMGTPTDEGGTGTDGLTDYSGPSNVSMQGVDGNSGTLGVACAASAQAPLPVQTADASVNMPTPTSVRFYDWKPTSRLTIKANLYAQASLLPDWDSLHPAETSNLATQFYANDQQGRVATLGLYFQKFAQGIWKYHILLEGQVQGLELATGELDFNQNGSLGEVKTLQALVLPSVEGQPNRPIDLDFGAPTASGGNGIDGTTSFVTASHVAEIGTAGAEGTIAEFLGWPPASPSCLAQLTTYVNIGGNLLSYAPIVANPWSNDHPPESFSAAVSVSVIDTFGQPVSLTLYYVRRSERTWEYHAITATSESSLDLGSGTLQFSANGQLLQHDELPPFRMLQFDGSRGPSVTFNFGYNSDLYMGYQFSSFASASDLWLNTDGHVALNGECTD